MIIPHAADSAGQHFSTGARCPGAGKVLKYAGYFYVCVCVQTIHFSAQEKNREIIVTDVFFDAGALN